MTGRAAQKAESVKLVALDVDGVMTDGTLFYHAMSEPETKAFNIKDGLGIKLLQRCDIDRIRHLCTWKIYISSAAPVSALDSFEVELRLRRVRSPSPSVTRPLMG